MRPARQKFPGFPRGVVEFSRGAAVGADGRALSLDYGDLEIAPGTVSLYSSRLPWHCPDVAAALLAEFPRAPPATIVDATAHIGADALGFLLAFPGARVLAIEVDPDVAAVLARNARRVLARLGLPPGQVEIVNADAVQALGDMPPADLIYLDPPWSEGDIAGLRLGGRPLSGLVGELARERAGAVLVKLPKASDLDAFEAEAGPGLRFARYRVRDIRHPDRPLPSYWLVAARAVAL